MSKNAGKVFEEQFQKSVPVYCLLHRIKDSAQSFVKSDLARFTRDNPCDFLMFDNDARKLYCLELKSTKYKSMSFDDVSQKDSQGKMIKKHQIESLLKFSRFSNVHAGLLLNFRDEDNDEESTYYIDIQKFYRMAQLVGKQSCNVSDLKIAGAIEITGVKKRVNYLWDIDKFLKRECKGA